MSPFYCFLYILTFSLLTHHYITPHSKPQHYKKKAKLPSGDAGKGKLWPENNGKEI